MAIFVLLFGMILSATGLFLLHYFRAVIVAIVILTVALIFWFFGNEPRSYGRHYDE